MMAASIPANESDRLKALEALEILDTFPDEAFDRLARLAGSLLGSPMALISLIDRDRQWFKSHYGLNSSETPRDIAFCAHAILGDEVFVVPDALKDERFVDNPLVVSDPRIRFYAGAPLKTRSGYNIGTLCILDRCPRFGLSVGQKQNLRDLAALVVDQLETRRILRTVQHTNTQPDETMKGSSHHLQSEFLAHISHELRNPMNAVIGYSDLMLAAPYGPLGDERYREYVAAIHASGGHMLALVTDILEYAQLEAGTLKLTLEAVDLSEIARETAQILGKLADDRGVKLVLPETLSGPLIEADTVKLRQILINLVSNAIKFTPRDGSVSVVVDDVDGMAKVSVRDTGVGIAADDMAKVMAPFGQVVRSLGRQEGFGLGLPITKSLIVRHGGYMTIDSTPGVGTNVHVFLPYRSDRLSF